MRRVKAIVAPLLEAAADDARDRWRHTRGQIGNIVFEDRGQRLGDRVALKGRGAREHLVHDDAKREDVGAMIDRLGPHLFRRHVAGGADDDADAGRVGDRRLRLGFLDADQFGHAEVQDLHAAVDA